MMQMVQFQEERLWARRRCAEIDGARDRRRRSRTAKRKTFGQPIIDNQVIHFRIAELATEVELLRSLVYRAVEEYIGGTDVTMLASMAKLKAGRLAARGRRRVPAVLGRHGLHVGTRRRAYRDTRLLSIGGGADEIMLGIICKLMGTLPGTSNVAEFKAANA